MNKNWSEATATRQTETRICFVTTFNIHLKIGADMKDEEVKLSLFTPCRHVAATPFIHILRHRLGILKVR
jgi:hypothetical protein